MLKANKIHTDDTPVAVLQPGRGSTKLGRLWSYVRDDRNAEPPASKLGVCFSGRGIYDKVMAVALLSDSTSRCQAEDFSGLFSA